MKMLEIKLTKSQKKKLTEAINEEKPRVDKYMALFQVMIDEWGEEDPVCRGGVVVGETCLKINKLFWDHWEENKT